MLFGITYTSQFSVGNILSPWDDFKSLLICLLLLHLVPQVSYPHYDIHKWCFLKPLASFTLLLESSHRVVDFSSDLVGQSDSTLFHSLKCDPNFYVFLRKHLLEHKYWTHGENTPWEEWGQITDFLLIFVCNMFHHFIFLTLFHFTFYIWNPILPFKP